MISNLRISVAELVVWALLAAAGLTWISFRVVDGAAWLMDWLRDRVTPLLEDEDDLPEEWDHDELELPPERTWEQMTSHQLPVVCPCGKPIDHVDFCYEERRERRPPAYEAEHRAHYVAMGFDYPSGLMARVRELAP